MQSLFSYPLPCPSALRIKPGGTQFLEFKVNLRFNLKSASAHGRRLIVLLPRPMPCIHIPVAGHCLFPYPCGSCMFPIAIRRARISLHSWNMGVLTLGLRPQWGATSSCCQEGPACCRMLAQAASLPWCSVLPPHLLMAARPLVWLCLCLLPSAGEFLYCVCFHGWSGPHPLASLVRPTTQLLLAESYFWDRA